MREVSENTALFTMHIEGKLVGLVCSHEDDLLKAGDKNFNMFLSDKTLKMFKFSKVEWNTFKNLGCEVEKLINGDFSLNQNSYIQNFKEVDLPTDSYIWKVKESERKKKEKLLVNYFGYPG